jgi:serine/threonine-protein kinase
VLDLNPGLARQLVAGGKLSSNHDATLSAAPEWGHNPAIVTVKVATTDAGTRTETPGQIVALELFDRFLTRVVKKPNSFRPTLSVNYQTTTVTPAGGSSGTGDRNEWSRPGRLGFANAEFQSHFKKIYNHQLSAQWDQFNTLMSRSIDAGLRSAIQNDRATQDYIRQQMTPRR